MANGIRSGIPLIRLPVIIPQPFQTSSRAAPEIPTAIGTGSAHPEKVRCEACPISTAAAFARPAVSVSVEAAAGVQDLEVDSVLAWASAVGVSASDTPSGRSAGIHGGTTRIGMAPTGMLPPFTVTIRGTTDIWTTTKTGPIIHRRIGPAHGLPTTLAEAT